ncbi:MAG: lysostaphin resistance A-like protein, partial [Rubrobacteraceae bacterium]
ALMKMLRGVAFGVIFFAVVSLLMGAMGFLAFERNDAGELQGYGALGGVLLVALGWAVQGSAEEVMFRGWLLQTAAARYGPLAGVLISTLVFALSHTFNLDFDPIALTNLFLTGLFFAFYALYEGSQWGVCALHAAMNWAEVNIFGFNQAGEEAPGGTILNFSEAGPDLVTGGNAAAVTAGGLIYTAVVLTGIATILFLAHRRKQTS